MSAPPTGGSPSVELLFGPLLIGVILSTAAYGVMSTQVNHLLHLAEPSLTVFQMLLYYQKYKSDASWIRYFMLFLFAAETVNLLFEIAIVYEPLIVRYGTPRAVVIAPLLLPGDAVSIVLVSTPVQFFTAWRIKVITGSFVIPFIICTLSVTSFVGGILVTIFVAIRNEFHEFQSFAPAVIVWLVSSAVCDVLITAVLTYSLATRKTGHFAAVDDQINRIIRLTVQTGAITAVAALADVILFLVFPATTLNFMPDFPLAKLYTISLLSTLNSRSRGRSEDGQRPPNALFSDSTTQKSTITSGGRAPSQYLNVHANNKYHSTNGTMASPTGRPFVIQGVADISFKDMHYPPDAADGSFIQIREDV
ncbi:hypothetical protein K438DRAFT_1972715 [Mycena galopus ATCC 62051]|nr:hypothetical protein K438DRAFT_1972715 [Mycena galopus ATCC 62051]